MLQVVVWVIINRLQVIESVAAAAEQHAQVAMLAKTHGQPASPTTMGKELAVFAFRLQRQRQQVCTLSSNEPLIFGLSTKAGRQETGGQLINEVGHASCAHVHKAL